MKAEGRTGDCDQFKPPEGGLDLDDLGRDLGRVSGFGLHPLQLWPPLPDAVQHLLVAHHLLKVPLVACRQGGGVRLTEGGVR